MKYSHSIVAEVDEVLFRGEGDRWIRACRAFATFYARAFHRLTIAAPCRVPRRGPAIIVCNHISGLDPILIQAGCRRPIRWMMAREYFDLRPLDWIYKTVGCIPVSRGARDTAATRAAIRALENDCVLGVFPEGKIETTRDLLPFQRGISLLAMRANAWVHPAYLDGTQRGLDMVPSYIRSNSAKLAFGRPIDLAGLAHSGSGIEQGTARIQASVFQLKEQYFDNKTEKDWSG